MSKLVGKFAIGTTVLFLFIFLAGPLVWLLGISFKSPIELLAYEPKLLPDEWQLENYREALAKSGIIRAFFNSLVVSGISTLVICILVIIPAYVFARNKGFFTKGMAFWILISQVFPLSLIIIPMFLTLQRVNLINSELGLILIYVVVNIPFSLWLLRSFVLNIPKEIEEAARIDGASTLYMLRAVILPLLIPGLIVVAIFTFVNVWNEFFFALVFLSDPEKATLPLKLAQFLGSEGKGRFGALAAATVIAILPALLMFAVIQRKFSDNFLAGAVKG